MRKGEKIYGVADRAWQVVVGCDPHMPCAPRCWARKTVARVVECQTAQHPERAAFFQVALTPDGKKWSGEVQLDEAHLTDPLKWRKPALIATGFHGDWGRLLWRDRNKIIATMALCRDHRFLPLTKEPSALAEHLGSKHVRGEVCDAGLGVSMRASKDRKRWSFARTAECDEGAVWPMSNVNIGCSVMNQAEADKYLPAMRELAALGWATHVWYEPAIGPVTWDGWDFLQGMISGGESGPDSRPSQAQWHRDTRDWCAERGVPYNFKQFGDWLPAMCDGATVNGSTVLNCSDAPQRVGKANAGRLLDGRTYDELPRFPGVRP